MSLTSEKGEKGDGKPGKGWIAPSSGPLGGNVSCFTQVTSNRMEELTHRVSQEPFSSNPGQMAACLLLELCCPGLPMKRLVELNLEAANSLSQTVFSIQV